MKLAHILKRFQKIGKPGSWLLGLLSLVLLSRLLFGWEVFALTPRSISLSAIVNQVSDMGLLIGLLWGGYYFILRPLKRCALPANAISPNDERRRGEKDLRENWNPRETLLDAFPTRLLTKRQPNRWEVDLKGSPLKNRTRWFSWVHVILQHGLGLMRAWGGRDARMVKYPQGELRWRQLDQALETLQLGVTITDLKGKILYTNPAEATMHGYEVRDLLGQDLGIFAPGRLRKPMTVEQMQALRSLRESVNIRKDGSIFPVRLMSDVIKNDAGQPIAIVTTSEDLTRRKRTEVILKQRTRELALLNRLSELLQACTAEKETYPVVEKICKKLFPQDSGCLSLLNPAEGKLKVVALWGNFAPPNVDGPELPTPVFQTLTMATMCPRLNFYPDNDCLCVPINAAGEMLGILSLCCKQLSPEMPLPEKNQIKATQLVLARVAEQYVLALVNLRLRETLRLESIRDPLTGLYNRRYMEESLEREARRAKRHQTSIGIIMLDIDHFKQVNDIYGHEAGDVVLQKLGKFLQRATRGEDIACRYGGEEFLLILPEASLAVVAQRAEELRTGVKQLKMSYHGQRLHITISVGVAVLPDHSAKVRDVVKAADTALYRAKASGRDVVIVA